MREGWVRVRYWRPFGAELWLHWSLLLVVGCALFGVARDPAFMGLVLAAYMLAIVVHEAGHAWTARYFGHDVDALEFSPLHGRCCYRGIDLTAREHFWITAAGPLAQLGLAMVVLALGLVPAIREWDPFGPVYVFAGYFNIVWALMNLLPARGLDGEVLWQHARAAWRERANRKRRGPPHLRRVK